MNDLYHRNEAICRYHVPGHTAYRALRCFARQHKAGSKKRPQEDAKPPPAEKNRSHGSPNARPRAGLVLRYKTGSFFIFIQAPTRCRGPPPLCLNTKFQTKEAVL